MTKISTVPVQYRCPTLSIGHSIYFCDVVLLLSAERRGPMFMVDEQCEHLCAEKKAEKIKRPYLNGALRAVRKSLCRIFDNNSINEPTTLKSNQI